MFDSECSVSLKRVGNRWVIYIDDMEYLSYATKKAALEALAGV